MTNMYLDCGLDSRLRTRDYERRLFLELLVNTFMQISVERDDPNKSSAVFY